MPDASAGLSIQAFDETTTSFKWAITYNAAQSRKMCWQVSGMAA